MRNAITLHLALASLAAAMSIPTSLEYPAPPAYPPVKPKRHVPHYAHVENNRAGRRQSGYGTEARLRKRLRADERAKAEAAIPDKYLNRGERERRRAEQEKANGW